MKRKRVYMVTPIGINTGSIAGDPLIFGSAYRSLAFAFGPNRETSRDADRVSWLHKGHSLSTWNDCRDGASLRCVSVSCRTVF